MATVQRDEAPSSRPWYVSRDLAGLGVVSVVAVTAIAVLTFWPATPHRTTQLAAAQSSGSGDTVPVDPPLEPTAAPAPLATGTVAPRSPVTAPPAEVTVNALTLDVRGGTGFVSGVTPAGVAYGLMAGPGKTMGQGRAVRWNVAPGRSHAPRGLPRAAATGSLAAPAVSAAGVVAWVTTGRGTGSAPAPVALVDGRVLTDPAALNSQVVDVNADGRVLLAQTSTPLDPSASHGKGAVRAYVWNPATGVRQRVPEPGSQLMDDGSVLIQRPYGMADAPRASLVWHGDATTPLTEPLGWTARISGGSTFAAIAGTLIQGTNGDPEQDITHAAVWRRGEIQVLPGLGGRAAGATDANAAGVIVGAAQTATGHPHAMRWVNGRGTDLGTLGGQRSWATDVSETGLIAGWSTTADGVQHAAAWLPDGRIIDLGAALGRSTESSAQGVSGKRIYGSRTGPDDTLIPVVWTLSRSERSSR